MTRRLRKLVIVCSMLAGAIADAWALPVAEIRDLSPGLSIVDAPVSGASTFTFGVVEGSIAAQYGYLNVVGNGAWLVRNMPLYLSDEVSSQANHAWFQDLGSSLGPAGGSITTSFIINDSPLSGPTVDGDWQTTTLTSGGFRWGHPDQAGQSLPPAPAAAAPLPPAPPDAAKIEGYLRGGVADLKQLRNECGPTSTANSLIWLAARYGVSDKLPRKPDGSVDQDQLVLDLAKAMKPGWKPGDVKDGNRGYPGLDDDQLKDGKASFIKRAGLPFVVHGGMNDPNAKGAKTFDFIKSELKAGQDVEFLIGWPTGGSHWVTVVGFIDAGDRRVLVVHDPLLGNGNHYWEIDKMGDLSSPQGVALWAVAESIPEPASMTLMAVGLFLLAGVVRRQRGPRRG